MNENVQMLAYIDPGTGSLVLQMILAGIVGAGVFFRRTIAKLFGRDKENPPKNPDEPGQKPS